VSELRRVVMAQRTQPVLVITDVFQISNGKQLNVETSSASSSPPKPLANLYTN